VVFVFREKARSNFQFVPFVELLFSHCAEGPVWSNNVRVPTANASEREKEEKRRKDAIKVCVPAVLEICVQGVFLCKCGSHLYKNKLRLFFLSRSHTRDGIKMCSYICLCTQCKSFLGPSIKSKAEMEKSASTRKKPIKIYWFS